MRTFYTVEFKLKALVELDKNNRNIHETARQLGISRTTLNNWSRDRDKIYELSEILAEKKRLPLDRRLNLLINQISDALPGMVENARLGDATRALSTLITLSESLKAKREASDAQDENVMEKLEKLMRNYEADPEAFMRETKSRG